MTDFRSLPPERGPTYRAQQERKAQQLLADLSQSLDIQHHDSPLRHQFGVTFEAPVTVADLGTSPFPGISDIPARSDHVHDGSNIVPVGTIVMTALGSAPSGWFFLEGGTIVGAQTSFPDAWAGLPTSWRSGANIVLPDGRDRFHIGLNSGQAAWDTPGELGGSFAISVANMPAHDHGGATGGESANHVHQTAGAFVNNTAGGAIYAGGIGGSVAGFTTNENVGHVHGVGSQGSGSNYFQPFIAFRYMIRIF